MVGRLNPAVRNPTAILHRSVILELRSTSPSASVPLPCSVFLHYSALLPTPTARTPSDTRRLLAAICWGVQGGSRKSLLLRVMNRL